jgi:hypothetical protein
MPAPLWPAPLGLPTNSLARPESSLEALARNAGNLLASAVSALTVSTWPPAPAQGQPLPVPATVGRKGSSSVFASSTSQTWRPTRLFGVPAMTLDVKPLATGIRSQLLCASPRLGVNDAENKAQYQGKHQNLVGVTSS